MPKIRTLWRVFPWEPGAEAGEPFSPSYINPSQEDGRYDLHGKPLILNLAESPAHAIAEQVQGRHGRSLRARDLMESGRPLAIVRVTIGDNWSAIPDLSLPRALHQFGCRPDQLMSRDPSCSQRLSRRLHRRGVSGFRVWSALSGDWHCTVLFMDRAVNLSLTFGRPRRLTFRSRGVVQAAKVLDIAFRSARSRRE
jgi:hypothetical protein